MSEGTDCNIMQQMCSCVQKLEILILCLTHSSYINGRILKALLWKDCDSA